MAQGSIAEDLGAHEQVLWLTTSFLIPMSSFAPVAGRLASIYQPRTLVPPISLFFAVGSLLCALANSFTVFIIGRVIAGVGAAGVLTLSIITVLELTSRKQRGIFIGLVNAGMTIGVSFGAVVYGALLPVIGWVSRANGPYQHHSSILMHNTASPLLDPGSYGHCCRCSPLCQSSELNEIPERRQDHLLVAKGEDHRLRRRWPPCEFFYTT